MGTTRDVYTRNRSEAVVRITLARRALDEALARAEVDGDPELADAVDAAVTACEEARRVALFETLGDE